MLYLSKLLSPRTVRLSLKGEGVSLQNNLQQVHAYSFILFLSNGMRVRSEAVSSGMFEPHSFKYVRPLSVRGEGVRVGCIGT